MRFGFYVMWVEFGGGSQPWIPYQLHVKYLFFALERRGRDVILSTRIPAVVSRAAACNARWLLHRKGKVRGRIEFPCDYFVRVVENPEGRKKEKR